MTISMSPSAWEAMTMWAEIDAAHPMEEAEDDGWEVEMILPTYDDSEESDPQWVDLNQNERREILTNVFLDDDWYNGPIPNFPTPFIDVTAEWAHQWTDEQLGLLSYPLFQEISDRLGAPVVDIRNYFAVHLRNVTQLPAWFISVYFQSIRDREGCRIELGKADWIYPEPEVINYVPRMQLL